MGLIATFDAEPGLKKEFLGLSTWEHHALYGRKRDMES